MKFTSQSLLTAATLATVASAAGHNHHQHAKFHQHEERAVDTVVVNDVAVKYVFDGQEVPLNQVCLGLANGTFVWDADAADKPNCSPNAAPVALSSAPATTQSAKAGVFLNVASSSSSSAAPKPSSSAAPAPAPAVASAPAANNNIAVTGSLLSLLVSNPGVNKPFPDGQLPCTFSSLQQYGAVPLNYLGFGGFSTIQRVTGDLMSSISIAQVNSGSDGDYFSYSCPSGYMKTQWPQQTTTNTVGGVQCVNGVFKLTQPGSSTLCAPGAGNVVASSSLSQQACICGTDYPGSESEIVPNIVTPGGTTNIAIRNTQTYYKWQGSMGTSNEYYINPLGVPVEQACNWGSNPTGTGNIGSGNWAPVVMGLGTDANNQNVYPSLQSAEQVLLDPANKGSITPLNYNVKLTCASSGQTCEYRNENGQGNFYMNGALKGTMGSYLASGGSGSVPGVTCGCPVGSDLTMELSPPS